MHTLVWIDIQIHFTHKTPLQTSLASVCRLFSVCFVCVSSDKCTVFWFLGATASCSTFYERGREVLIRNSFCTFDHAVFFFLSFNFPVISSVFRSHIKRLQLIQAQRRMQLFIYGFSVLFRRSMVFLSRFSLPLFICFHSTLGFFINSFCIETLQPVQMHVNFNTRVQKKITSGNKCSKKKTQRKKRFSSMRFDAMHNFNLFLIFHTRKNATDFYRIFFSLFSNNKQLWINCRKKLVK